MSPFLATLMSFGGALIDRHRQLRADPDRGAVSIEQVIITLALLGIAAALVAVIGAAVTDRSDQIQ